MQLQQSTCQFCGVSLLRVGGTVGVELCLFHSDLVDFALWTSQSLDLRFLFGSFFPFLTSPVNEKMLPNRTWTCLSCTMLQVMSLTVLCCCPWLPPFGLSLSMPP